MIQLNPGEQLLATERRHWLPIVLESVSISLAAFIPLLLLIGAEFLPWDTKAAIAEYGALAWFFYGVWLLGLWMVFAISMTNYYLDVLFVTSMRIIDVEQLGLFSRDVAELHLNNIEDVRVQIKGFIHSLLNYGDLNIQTAGESREFFMKNMRDPHRIQEIIFRARLALKDRPADSNSPAEQGR